MDAGEFDQETFYRTVFGSGCQVLLIGRQALLALGIPVMTADYDLWLRFDDVERLNDALAPMGFGPNKTPEDARKAGRYVLENSEHVDVLMARSVPTVQGVSVAFDDLWTRRQTIPLCAGVDLSLPSIDDLIATKLFSARHRDMADISLLESLKRRLGK